MKTIILPNEDSRKILDAVFPQGDAWLVMGLHDASDVMHPTAEGRPGSFDLRDDRDLYYCVSTTGPAGRKDVRRVMVLVIDDVGKEIDREGFGMLAPEPSFMVESSKGSFQAGYIIEGGMTPGDYDALRAAMKAHPVWGKAHGFDAAHIFRLPQGTHTKSSRGGWQVRLATWTGLRYTPEQLRFHMLPAASVSGVAATIAAKAFTWELDEAALQALVDLIPNEAATTRDEWLRVMHGIMGAGGGFEVFDSYSARWNWYDAGHTWRAWDTAVPGNVRSGGGLLRELAEKANSAKFEAWRQAWEAPAVFDDDMGLLGASAGDDGKGDKGESVEALQSTVADALIRRYGNRLRWNVEAATWHRFRAVWEKSPFREGYELARLWAQAALPSLGKASRGMVSKSGFYEGVEQIMRSALAVTQDSFDQDDWLLGTPGGTVELRTGLLVPARAPDMISLSTSVTPSAGEDCPKWKKFIDWACTDAGGKVDVGMVRFLRQWAGYCLTGDVSKEMVVFLHGVGANGKGTFIETLQAVMGTYFFMAPKDLFMERKHGAHTEEIAGLANVRMVAADEVPVTARWDESLLKAVSGSGKMTARHLYGRVFTFRIRFKVTISGNNKPTFQGEINEALKRRLHMAGFLQVAKPKSDTLKAELAAEGRGILRWMLNGLSDMLGSPGGKLFVADSMLATTEDYFNDNDLFGQWLGERVKKTKGGETEAKDVYNDWVSWRNAQGNHFMFNRPNTFKAEMEKRGFVWMKTKKTNVYKNISIEMF